MYKGELAGFPEEVVEWMLDNQVKQGNPRNVSVFEINRAANAEQKGFDWDQTTEDAKFCQEVISFKYFDVFFEKYPKKQLQKSEYPKVMMVSDSPITEENKGYRLVVFHYQPNAATPYFVYCDTENISDIKESSMIVTSYVYAKDIEPEPEFPKELQSLLDKKAEEDNQIDLNAYSKGLLDCYNKLIKQ
jgi:hypothetical protein